MNLTGAIRVLLLHLVMLGIAIYGQEWHHSPSPYRAVFAIPAPAPEAGVLLNIPVCGLGKPNGADVFCFNEKGRQLLLRRMGPGWPNASMVQVIPQGKHVYAYFGSSLNAPQAKMTLTPPICEVYDLGKLGSEAKWPAVERHLENASLIGRIPVRELAMTCNPVDGRERFLMVLTAMLDTPQGGRRNFFVASDDAGYLLVDNRLVIERNGIHGPWDSLRGENRQEIAFTPGLHQLRLVGVNYEKQFTLALGEWFAKPKPRVAMVPERSFVQCGTAALTKVEAQGRKPMPIFRFEHIAYMQTAEVSLTAVALENYGGEDARWVFGDGVQMSGAKVTRAFATLNPVSVRCTVRDVTASGTIYFPQNAPRQLRYQNLKDRGQMAAWIEPAMTRQKDPEQLFAFLRFFQEDELDARQVPLAERILKTSELDGKTRIATLLSLARAAAKDSPDKAVRAWRELLHQKQQPRQFADCFAEAMEFLVYRQLDYAAAAQCLTEYETRLPRDGRLVAAWQFDLARLQGKKEEAAKHFHSLLNRRVKQQENRVFTAQGNALYANVEERLATGRIVEAESELRRWIVQTPQARADGRYSLIRARCLRKRGWLDGAVAELVGAINYEPLLPNLPDVEFELAGLYQDKGEKGRAQELWSRIVKEYPLHPLAAEARKMIRP